jgi:penicillin-binding protein 1A
VIRKVLQGTFLVLLTALLSVGSLFGASALRWANELPSLDHARHARVQRDLAGARARRHPDRPDRAGVRRGPRVANRIPVSLDEISPAALQAIVAYEDADFFRHYGFDPLGVARAFYEEFFGDADRGGSTITTQVVKNTVLFDLRSDRSLERKAKELMLAVELERRLTKPEILPATSTWSSGAATSTASAPPPRPTSARTRASSPSPRGSTSRA